MTFANRLRPSRPGVNRFPITDAETCFGYHELTAILVSWEVMFTLMALVGRTVMLSVQYLSLAMLVFAERSLTAAAEGVGAMGTDVLAQQARAQATSLISPPDSLASDSVEDHTSWRSRDESMSTYWATDRTDVPQSIRYDLGAVTTISGIQIAWFNGIAQKYRFDIALSDDAVTWRPVATGLSSAGSSVAETYTFAAQEARHVRVTIAASAGVKLVGITEAALLVPVVSALAAPGALTPEGFGARGDGKTDDTAALTALFNAANKQGNPIAFGTGRTYLTDRTRMYQYSLTTNGLNVQGNGATIKVKDGVPTASSLYVLRIAAQNVTVENLTVDANRARRAAPANWNQFGWFIDGGSVNVRLRNIRGVNSPVDNLYIRDQVGRNSDRLYPREIYIENAEMLNAARNNASLISSRNVYITGGKFNGANGANPEAGIDIEPNASDPFGNNGVFLTNVETSNNRGGGVDVAGHNNANIVVRNHVANNNGTAFFAAPDGGAIQVDGLTGSNYTSNPVAAGRNGFVSLVPGGRSGAKVVLQNVTLTGINSPLPGVHQNYAGVVSIHDTQINRYTGNRPVVEAKPADIYNIYRDGVKIR